MMTHTPAAGTAMSRPEMLRIATRESPLALWQACFVRDRLLALYPGLVVELVGLTTEGDRILGMPLAKIGGKGLFIKELEQALADGRADLAVHSMKDVPMRLPDGRVRLPGRLRVDEAHEWVGVLWTGDSDTVGGMVSERLGHIPDPGERVEIDGVEVEVERADDLVVHSVLARPRQAAGEARP